MAGDVAIVTGSTAGLGKEIARLFAAEGALVVVTGRNRERGEAIAAELRASSGEASFVAADLTVDDDAYALIDATIARYDALHVLVNNAVSPEIIARDGKAADVSNEVWESMLRVNVLGPAWLLQKAIPQMLEQRRGSIVNISSRTAERASPRLAAYTASKGAMNALARSITLDYGRDGIRCNTVQPGYILHERRDADLDDERRRRLEGMHLTRLGTADDIAYAALYLASSEAEFVTGINLPVDGGSTAARGLVLG